MNYFQEDTENTILLISSTISFLPYGALLDEFQHEVYENTHESAERKQTWRRLKRFTYRKDYGDDKMMDKVHIKYHQGHISQPFTILIILLPK